MTHKKLMFLTYIQLFSSILNVIFAEGLCVSAYGILYFVSFLVGFTREM